MRWYKIVMLLAIAFVIIVSVSTAENDPLQITFVINQDDSVSWQLLYKGLENLEYHIDKTVASAQNFNGTAVQQFTTDDNGTFLNLTIKASPTQMDLIIKDAIFHNQNSSHFFTELVFDPKTVKTISARAVLPSGYTLINHDYKPESGTVTSDGKFIIVEWRNVSTQRPIIFSVKYQKVRQSISGWVLGSILVVLCTLFYIYSQGQIKTNFLRGFREDEIKAILFLKKQHVILQKDLQKEFGFSRAKATRVIKKLEEKKIISKEAFGRTNKITWKAK